MVKIAILLGSTRPGRVGAAVGQWAYEIAGECSDADFELVDTAQFNLPLLDEAMPATSGQYSRPHKRGVRDDRLVRRVCHRHARVPNPQGGGKGIRTPY